MSNAIPKDRVRIFNKDGEALGEFRPVVERSWAIGEEGRAQFTYPTRQTDIINETNIRYGNWLLVESDALPPWVGVIDFPRTVGGGKVQVSAYTPEHLFTWRIGPQSESLSRYPGGYFEYLISFANGQDKTILRVGKIYSDGTKISKQLCPKFLSEYLKEVVDESGQEYSFRPVVSGDGKLRVYGDWETEGGTGATTSLILQDRKGNVKAEDNIMTEDGQLINNMWVYGSGSLEWWARPAVNALDEDSIHKYGMRHGIEVKDGIRDKSALGKIARQKLKELKNAKRTFSLTALNVGDTFAYMKPGNRFTLRLTDAALGEGLGYQEKVRITGMSYDPKTPGELQLVVEET